MEGLKHTAERRTALASGGAPQTPPLTEAALIVSARGDIETILPNLDTVDGPGPAVGQTISDIWPTPVASAASDAIRDALRHRRVRREEVTQHDDPAQYELIAVPQGRDRVLLLLRNLTRLYGLRSEAESAAASVALPARDFLLTELQRVVDMQALREGRAALICLNISQLDDGGHVFAPGQQEDILRELGERLANELRGPNEQVITDFSQLSIVARFDYRQFAVALPAIDSGTDAESVAERLVAVLQKPVDISGHQTAVSASAGIALFPQDGTDAETLFGSACAAMEDAAANRTSQLRFHSGTLRLPSLQRQDLELSLKTALASDALALSYLPIVDAHSRGVCAVEGLLRWPDSMLLAQSVRQIVSVAERTGLILPIGRWVVEQACRQITALRAERDEDLRLTVNVSAQEYSRPEYASELATLLEELDFDPALLDVEIEERVLFRDAMRSFAASRELRALGIGVVVDDFGTGACSLENLARSPVTAIKIDNRLVADLEQDERKRATCMAAIGIAKSLGMTSIGEGVETVYQASFLRDHGCDQLQGFFLTEPLDRGELIELFDLSATSRITKLWADN